MLGTVELPGWQDWGSVFPFKVSKTVQWSFGFARSEGFTMQTFYVLHFRQSAKLPNIHFGLLIFKMRPFSVPTHSTLPLLSGQ